MSGVFGSGRCPQAPRLRLHFAIVNNATKNAGVPAPGEVPVSSPLGHIPGSSIAGAHSHSVAILRNGRAVLRVRTTTCHSIAGRSSAFSSSLVLLLQPQVHRRLSVALTSLGTRELSILPYAHGALACLLWRTVYFSHLSVFNQVGGSVVAEL